MRKLLSLDHKAKQQSKNSVKLNRKAQRDFKFKVTFIITQQIINYLNIKFERQNIIAKSISDPKTG